MGIPAPQHAEKMAYATAPAACVSVQQPAALPTSHAEPSEKSTLQKTCLGLHSRPISPDAAFVLLALEEARHISVMENAAPYLPSVLSKAAELLPAGHI